MAEVENRVDKEFNIDMNDPWQGTQPEWDFVPLKAKDPEALGFYWLWPCLTNPDAPIMVEYMGGPGYSCMIKAFTNRTPLQISGKDKCITKSENPLTNKWNMLFIESPINSGFSTSKKNVTSFKEENDYQRQIYEFILSKHPSFVNNEWVITGESYAGLGICKTSVMLIKELDFKIKGVYAMVPVLNRREQLGTWDQYELLKEIGYLKSCCDKCMCSYYFGCIVCYNKMCCGLSVATNELLEIIPLLKKAKKNKDDKKTYLPISIMNVASKDVDIDTLLTDPWNSDFVSSKLFQNLLGFKGKFESPTPCTIMEKDPCPNSKEELNYLIDAGIQVQLTVGEGDYIINAKKVELLLKEVPFSFCEEFSKLEYKTEDEVTKRKTMKNLSFVKLSGVGHCCSTDAPEWFHKDFQDFGMKCFTFSSDDENKNMVPEKQPLQEAENLEEME